MPPIFETISIADLVLKFGKQYIPNLCRVVLGVTQPVKFLANENPLLQVTRPITK